MAYKQSQFGQDDWVLSQFKTGFFVEAGAADGFDISNSYRLEQNGWDGICCEPHPFLFQKLKQNRKCKTDNRCLSDKSDELVDFSLDGCPTWSGCPTYFKDKLNRKELNVIQVNTISLKDLLIFHNAPKEITYLSLDTEGTELLILKAFDFSYTFNLITVEHNHVEDKRKEIRDLLESKGYKFIQEKVEDDWYRRI